jgi:hypothetical protein|tara:strand:+ start:435 stop:593 length:159 start_codon:yes stop_codon:yes gene_type:complete
VYGLPVYLRTFYYKQLLETKKKEKEEMDKASKGKSPSSGPPSIPSFAKTPQK